MLILLKGYPRFLSYCDGSKRVKVIRQSVFGSRNNGYFVRILVWYLSKRPSNIVYSPCKNRDKMIMIIE